MVNRLSVSAVFVAAVAVALSSAACSHDWTGPVAPAASEGSQKGGSVQAIAIQPTPLVRRPVVGFVCPFNQPFVVPFDLLIRSGDSTLFLNEVRIDFVDSFGTSGPQLTIPRPDLNLRFRTTAIPPLGTRAFPFSFEFGCLTVPRGIVGVFVQTVDERGLTTQGRVNVPVR
jgi:hypothetical protein